MTSCYRHCHAPCYFAALMSIASFNVIAPTHERRVKSLYLACDCCGIVQGLQELVLEFLAASCSCSISASGFDAHAPISVAVGYTTFMLRCHFDLSFVTAWQLPMQIQHSPCKVSSYLSTNFALLHVCTAEVLVHVLLFPMGQLLCPNAILHNRPQPRKLTPMQILGQHQAARQEEHCHVHARPKNCSYMKMKQLESS